MKYIIKNLLTNEEEEYKETAKGTYNFIDKIVKYVEIKIPIEVNYNYEEDE